MERRCEEMVVVGAYGPRRWFLQGLLSVQVLRGYPTLPSGMLNFAQTFSERSCHKYSCTFSLSSCPPHLRLLDILKRGHNITQQSLTFRSSPDLVWEAKL